MAKRNKVAMARHGEPGLPIPAAVEQPDMPDAPADEYARLFMKEAADAGKRVFREWLAGIPVMSPQAMCAELERHGYVGQERARRAVCLMAHRHVKRIRRLHLDGVARERLPPKANMLLVGPTGCGKSHLVELLFRLVLRVPVALVDITTFSETGYVGDDPKTILTRLLIAAGDDPLKASVGVVCLDEFDKLSGGQNCAVFAGAGTTKDVSGRGVQRELLKMLEAGDMLVPTEISRSNYAPVVKINTADIPFIACGAFSGLKATAAAATGATRMGFRPDSPDGESHFRIAVGLSRQEVMPVANFAEYGMMPELIGRFTRVVPFEAMGKATLREILERNTVVQYRNELELDGLELRIADEVYDFLIEECLRMETGARGLQSLLCEYLEDACFEVHSAAKPRRAVELVVADGQVKSRIVA